MTDLFQDSDPATAADGSAGRRSAARSGRRRDRKRKSQRRRTLITFVVMIVALALLIGGAWVLLRPFLDRGPTVPTNEASDYPGPGTGSVEVVVSTGDSGAMIGQTLATADVVASVEAFVAAYNANPDAPSIQPGTYDLPMQIPATDAVTALLDPANRSNGLTIPEGWRASQIYDRVAEVLEVPVEDVEAAAADVELPDEAQGEIEGWLYPSTYSPASDATPQTVLQEMVDQTVAALERNDVPREDWFDVIVKASIIEREVSRDEDRPLVAEVIDNRLALCDGAGLLGMDSTLVYELGKPGNEITATEWATATPYNTRVTPGLPPTAISSPSESSIAAAAQPAEGDYCYFVTVNLDTGETKFTADKAEFDQFVQEYRDWLEENR